MMPHSIQPPKGVLSYQSLISFRESLPAVSEKPEQEIAEPLPMRLGEEKPTP